MRSIEWIYLQIPQRIPNVVFTITGKDKASSLDIAPLTILNSGVLQLGSGS